VHLSELSCHHGTIAIESQLGTKANVEQQSDSHHRGPEPSQMWPSSLLETGITPPIPVWE
jgi:hypothetical protein